MINFVFGVSFYIWIVIGGNVLFGQGSISVQVFWISVGGEVCVVVFNICGSSLFGCLMVDGNIILFLFMIFVFGGIFDMGCIVEQMQSDCVSLEFFVYIVILFFF